MSKAAAQKDGSTTTSANVHTMTSSSTAKSAPKSLSSGTSQAKLLPASMQQPQADGAKNKAPQPNQQEQQYKQQQQQQQSQHKLKASHQVNPGQQQTSHAVQPTTTSRKKRQVQFPAGLAIVGGASVFALLALWQVVRAVRRSQSSRGGEGGASSTAQGKGTNGSAQTAGPCSRVKPSPKCVALADGSACVVRREIPADNSCLFNAVGYAMHKAKSKARFLRDVVARDVSGDPEYYSSAFLGMDNASYCAWIQNPHNWGGGIELAILAKHYGREIAAWNIESGKCHVFGEEAGHPKQVMVIYNGVHYDALAISPGPRAPPGEDVTEFNPRTKRGKMIIAAARQLVELAHRKSQFYKPGGASGPRLVCGDCGTLCKDKAEAGEHAKATGHVRFEQVK